MNRGHGTPDLFTDATHPSPPAGRRVRHPDVAPGRAALSIAVVFGVRR